MNRILKIFFNSETENITVDYETNTNKSAMNTESTTESTTEPTMETVTSITDSSQIPVSVSTTTATSEVVTVDYSDKLDSVIVCLVILIVMFGVLLGHVFITEFLNRFR